MWFKHYHNIIQKAVLLDSSMQEVGISSIFVYYSNFVLELTTTIKPGNYHLRLLYQGIILRDYNLSEFYVSCKERNITS